MTWRDSALWEISSALAAAVKLPCFATPSNARNAFKGSQRRSIALVRKVLLLSEAPSGSRRREVRPARAGDAPCCHLMVADSPALAKGRRMPFFDAASEFF